MQEVSNEFLEFLRTYGVIGLAIGVVVGGATQDLVDAVVTGMIMPIVDLVLPGGNWETMTTAVGPVSFQTGQLLSAFIDFFIIALLVFAFMKYILGKEDVEKIG